MKHRADPARGTRAMHEVSWQAISMWVMRSGSLAEIWRWRAFRPQVFGRSQPSRFVGGGPHNLNQLWLLVRPVVFTSTECFDRNDIAAPQFSLGPEAATRARNIVNPCVLRAGVTFCVI